MLLPNGERAIVDIRKLRDYCLNPDNPRGSRKARVEICVGNDKSRRASAAPKVVASRRFGPAQVGELDRYGQRYTLDFELREGTRKVVVRSGWIILSNETAPRLTTCYVKKRKR